VTFAGARVHFIGIGGAGMSAIAKVLLERGVRVSGSDLKGSRATTVLGAMGAVVTIGHDADSVAGADLIVVSAAIPEHNVELVAARAEGLRVLGRGEALAELVKGARSIVVAGTHGKTTTTSMIVSILRDSGADPTYLVGGGLNDAGTNARSGAGELIVAESDESDGSFLLLSPHIAVVTNIEMDHVDHWTSMDELTGAFERFMGATDRDGAIVVPAGGVIEAMARASGHRVVTFGLDGDVSADDITADGHDTSFTLRAGDVAVAVSLYGLGGHNVSNALAAAASALAVGLDVEAIGRGLAAFRGVERRFDIQGSARGVTVVDDYAHHPTEVRATLSAAQLGPWDRVVAVFQPHRYSRTAALYEAFGASFSDADRVVITDIYGAGEEPVPGVTGKLISDAVCVSLPGRSVVYLPHRADVLTYLGSAVRSGDLVLTLGAGDVTSLGDELLLRLDDGS
jgi:UDP-N-acetylmuramate--alanine ligase